MSRKSHNSKGAFGYKSKPLNATISQWIDDEHQRFKKEGVAASNFITPQWLAITFHDVLAAHVDELLASKDLSLALKSVFQQRGLTGDLWFATMVMIGQEMNREQMRIFSWLMEGDTKEKDGVTMVSASDLKGPQTN